jgi:HAD superfamily phosphatase (TIGR01668 family)
VSWLQPDYYYSSLFAVDLAMLADQGIQGIVIDMDNTILPRDTNALEQRAHEWVRDARSRFGVMIVSNNTHSYPKDIAAQLGLPIMTHALKPMPRAFRAAMRRLGTTKRTTAVIGDQLFTDVFGGNLAGATTVLVDPLVEHDLPHTVALRKLTAPIIRHRRPLA